MIANRILNVILIVSAIVVLPIQCVTTFVLGLAVFLTFGLLLLPISLVWAVFLFPMIAVSWLCNRLPLLRNTLGIVFIPWALLANTFVAIMPSMGELESRAAKLMLCGAWPFTWEFWQFLSRRLDLESADPDAVALRQVVESMSSKDPLMQRVLLRVAVGQPLDPDV
jgi:hypothetical protein